MRRLILFLVVLVVMMVSGCATHHALEVGKKQRQQNLWQALGQKSQTVKQGSSTQGNYRYGYDKNYVVVALLGVRANKDAQKAFQKGGSMKVWQGVRSGRLQRLNTPVELTITFKNADLSALEGVCQLKGDRARMARKTPIEPVDVERQSGKVVFKHDFLGDKLWSIAVSDSFVNRFTTVNVSVEGGFELPQRGKLTTLPGVLQRVKNTEDPAVLFSFGKQQVTQNGNGSFMTINVWDIDGLPRSLRSSVLSLVKKNRKIPSFQEGKSFSVEFGAKLRKMAQQGRVERATGSLQAVVSLIDTNASSEIINEEKIENVNIHNGIARVNLPPQARKKVVRIIFNNDDVLSPTRAYTGEKEIRIYPQSWQGISGFHTHVLVR